MERLQEGHRLGSIAFSDSPPLYIQLKYLCLRVALEKVTQQANVFKVRRASFVVFCVLEYKSLCNNVDEADGDRQTEHGIKNLFFIMFVLNCLETVCI